LKLEIRNLELGIRREGEQANAAGFSKVSVELAQWGANALELWGKHTMFVLSHCFFAT
jgi:hypothetical protein